MGGQKAFAQIARSRPPLTGVSWALRARETPVRGGRDPNSLCSANPDPPILAFLEKARVFPKKARVFHFAEPLKSLEKRGKTHKKARKIGKRKKQGNQKKQGLEGQGKFMPILFFRRAPRF